MLNRVRSHFRKHRLPRVSLALAAFVVAGLASAPAQAAEKGVVPEITWGVDSQTQDRIATHISDLGAKYVRLNISWSDWVEPNRGSYKSSTLSYWDRAITLSRQAGAQVIIMIDESPSWARDTTNGNAPPRDVNEYARFAGYVANRWRGQVAAYEIWNEPNGGAYRVEPQQYGAMIKAAGPAIRAADPATKVMYAGTFTNDYGYMESVYDRHPDLSNYFDIIGAHPYVWGIGPDAYYRDPNGRISPRTFAGYRELRNTVRNRGGGDKPVWITEMGWATTSTGASWGVTPQAQAALLTQAYKCLEQDPFVQVATTYNLRNNWFSNNAENWDAQLGLMKTDWTRKPAYDSLKNYQPGGGGCTYRDFTGSGTATTASASATTGLTPASAPRKATSPRLNLRVRKARVARRSARVAARGGVIAASGRVAGAKSGSKVVLTFDRRTARGYVTAYRVTVPVRSTGAFSRLQRARWSGRWRVRALLGRTRTAPASPYAYVTL
jgi:hypothetical protein